MTTFRPSLFAIEDTTAQLTWRTSRRGTVTVTCGPTALTLELDGGPGSCVIEGLAPATHHLARFACGGRTLAEVALRTLDSLDGPELFRFATINDLHLGRTHFGLRKTIVEHAVDIPHPARCASAAIDDLAAWGAQHLVIKGDMVDASTPQHWTMAADLLDDLPVPYHAIPGNHEMAHGTVSARAQCAIHGIHLVDGVETLDVPGLRLIMMDSTVEGIDVGRWHHQLHAVVDAAAEADGPAVLLVHHQPQRTPIPVYFPAGISSFAATRFLRKMTAANPAMLGSSGHTHRHRRHTLAGIPWTEVGSTKDYPGTWAGYVVHETGIRQVVRRVGRPDCLGWTDRTRAAAGGVWAIWSPGRLTDRCFVHEWPRP